MTISDRRRWRPNWAAILAWGTILTTCTTSAAGLATWSWRDTGMAVAITVALFALLILALWIFGRG